MARPCRGPTGLGRGALDAEGARPATAPGSTDNAARAAIGRRTLTAPSRMKARRLPIPGRSSSGILRLAGRHGRGAPGGPPLDDKLEARCPSTIRAEAGLGGEGCGQVRTARQLLVTDREAGHDFGQARRARWMGSGAPSNVSSGAARNRSRNRRADRRQRNPPRARAARGDFRLVAWPDPPPRQGRRPADAGRPEAAAGCFPPVQRRRDERLSGAPEGESATRRPRSRPSWPSRCSARCTSCCAGCTQRTAHDRRSRAERPDHLYEGLLTVLMRLVFILYAEDRELLPPLQTERRKRIYETSYAVRSPLRQARWRTRRQPRHDGRARRRLGPAPRPVPPDSWRPSTGLIRGAAASCSTPTPFLFSRAATHAADPPRVLSRLRRLRRCVSSKA